MSRFLTGEVRNPAHSWWKAQQKQMASKWTKSFLKKNHLLQCSLGNLLPGLTSTPGGSDLGDLQTKLSDIKQDADVACSEGQYRIQYIRGAQ